MKQGTSIASRQGKGKGGGDSKYTSSRSGEKHHCAPEVPVPHLPNIFICPTHAAAVTESSIEAPSAVPIATASPSLQIGTMPPIISMDVTTPTMCLSTPCDDQNVCTVDTCQKNDMMGCIHTPVTCGDNEACDTIDGLCKDIDSLRPCIAVIDESDSFLDSDMDARWLSFRTHFPTRPFCLLQPVNPDSDYLYFPTNPDFLTDPRVTFAVVNRDNGYTEYEMDWLELCGYTNIGSTGIDFVSFFIDESGSMDRTTVAASLLKFINDLDVSNLTYCLVFDETEDWITPFDTVLGSVGGGGACSSTVP